MLTTSAKNKKLFFSCYLDRAKTNMANILLLNGPNLNLLGTREPGVYGSDSLADIEDRLSKLAKKAHHTLIAFQSNSESDLPFIEIHLSNVYQREDFRHHSYFSDIAKGSIIGLGAQAMNWHYKRHLISLYLVQITNI